MRLETVHNECVGCSTLGLPCLGASCSNREVIHIRYCCDDCNEVFEPHQLYDVDGEEVCLSCLKKRLEHDSLTNDENDEDFDIDSYIEENFCKIQL